MPESTTLPDRNATEFDHLESLNLLVQPVWIFDIDRNRVHWANLPALAIWNATSPTELRERAMGMDMSASVAHRLKQYQSDFHVHAATFHEQWTLYPEGRPVPLTVILSGHRLQDGRMAMLCEARTLQQQNPESSRSVEALLHTAVMISLYRLDGVPLYRNPAARSSVRILDERLADRISDRQAYRSLMQTVEQFGIATETVAVQTSEGERWHEISARRCQDAVTGQDAVLVSEADVSAIKHAEERSRFLALHDPLTGLPNRRYLVNQFAEAATQTSHHHLQAALVFIDLDNFKDVNDTLGHAAGDQLLIKVAQRLRSAVRTSDLVARLGGDEFLVLMTGENINQELDRVRDRVTQAITTPIDLDGQEVCVTPSLGVSFYPQDGRDIETMLRNADLAMYSAKERGRNELAFYNSEMTTALHKRTAIEADLQHALKRKEFEVHYQPIVDVISGRITSAEALVRWRHPVRGLVQPDIFIPVCENSGLIAAVGAFVFDTAVRQQVAWARDGYELDVSVNVSARQLRNPALPDELEAILAAADGNPHRMRLEITESILLGQDTALMQSLTQMDATGMTITLDDFGTGYSNLAYLQRYPIQTLKIDKAFVQEVGTEGSIADIIVALCRLMKLKVVAEGVETASQLAWVRNHEIEEYQGFLFSKPLQSDEFTLFLKRHFCPPAM